MPDQYYVSPAGSDSNNGTSATSPWQTIAKVNSFAFPQGSTVSFQGGQTFTGCLTFNTQRPLVLGFDTLHRQRRSPQVVPALAQGPTALSPGLNAAIRIAGARQRRCRQQ